MFALSTSVLAHGLLALLAEAPTAAPPTRAEQAPRADSGPALRSLDAPTEQALSRALDWLAAPATAGPTLALPLGKQSAPVGVHALAILAWLAGGSTPGRGPHGAALDRGVDWLLRQADQRPDSPTRGYFHASGDEVSRMHGHGLATLALAQAWCVGRAHRRGEEMGRALVEAVRLIERAQGTEGGWGYDARPRFDHEGSITICMVQALRAAHDAGVHVNQETIARAERYVLASQDEDGAFRYMLGDQRRSVALTAAAMSTLNMVGRYQGPALERGLDALRRGLLARESGDVLRAPGRPDEEILCPFYERLYVAQALWQLPDERVFGDWSRRERERLLADQQPDGRWRDERFGDAYATAVNCLVLALPRGYLPVFQR
ncbi:MAG: terpene cyclase/mutase family protein [Planctomycetes bacterium]|nr:terpene cyclase/mutase family protein [Planctomycetota bacterium]